MKNITRLIVSAAMFTSLAACTTTQSMNQQAANDAVEINQAELWPKPANPVASGSENSAALKVV